HEVLVKVKRCPSRDMTASQEELMFAPAGMSNDTVQPLMAESVPLVIVYLASKPVPHSAVLVNSAVAEAAEAGVAVATPAPVSARAARTAMAVRRNLICPAPWGVVWRRGGSGRHSRSLLGKFPKSYRDA